MIEEKKIIMERVPRSSSRAESKEMGQGEDKKSSIGKHVFIFCTLFLLLVTPLFSQKTKTLLADGDKAFADKDYFSAAGYYNKAILQDSSDIVVQYKYADASRLNFDYDIAEHWYTKVFKKDAQGKLYPECSFWLATLKKSK